MKHTMIYLILYRQSLFMAIMGAQKKKKKGVQVNPIEYPEITCQQFSQVFYPGTKLNIFYWRSEDVGKNWGFCSIPKCPWNPSLCLINAKLKHLLIFFFMSP